MLTELSPADETVAAKPRKLQRFGSIAVDPADVICVVNDEHNNSMLTLQPNGQQGSQMVIDVGRVSLEPLLKYFESMGSAYPDSVLRDSGHQYGCSAEPDVPAVEAGREAQEWPECTDL